MTNKCLFIFIDESGNFDFSPTGTKYFVLTAAFIGSFAKH
ncbi:DUF3800 domain-containing protein [Patescibacteria group bacterium]|nr:DUF3800 domain-containing protein [Patescibacteria group bacterium]MBU1500010.1 DUF3800 domain-containing protein [Patescibacteria group bacterium]